MKLSASSFERLAEEAPDIATPFLLAIGKTLTTPLWRVFDNVLWSEESLLGADIESGGYNECRARSEKNDVRKLAFRHHVCSLASLAYAAVG